MRILVLTAKLIDLIFLVQLFTVIIILFNLNSVSAPLNKVIIFGRASRRLPLMGFVEHQGRGSWRYKYYF